MPKRQKKKTDIWEFAKIKSSVFQRHGGRNRITTGKAWEASGSWNTQRTLMVIIKKQPNEGTSRTLEWHLPARSTGSWHSPEKLTSMTTKPQRDATLWLFNYVRYQTENGKYWWKRGGALVTITPCWWECEMVQQSLKTAWHLLGKCENHHLIQSWNSTLRSMFERAENACHAEA